MKKIRNVFMVTMVLVALMTGVAYGASYTGSDDVRGVTYNKEMTGTKLKVYAMGMSTQAYTTATNITTDTLVVTAETWEYTHNSGITAKTDNKNTQLNYGEQVHSGYLTRQLDSDIVEYCHYATVYSNPGLTGTIESFKYVGNQYYRE